MAIPTPLDRTDPSSLRSTTSVAEHFCCSQDLPDFGIAEMQKSEPGFFQFGSDVVCYGRSTGYASSAIDERLFDASENIHRSKSTVVLPFDVDEIVNNLRYERYVNPSGWQAWIQRSWARDVYYLLRPFLPLPVRKQLQMIYLRDWNTITFPNWPIDRTVDVLFERLLVLAMQALSITNIPFIWFWPESYQSAAIVTHDVETLAGRKFSEHVMDIDDEFGIKSSFQIVPENRYPVSDAYLETIRQRKFELNVHGLNHDGNLFRDRDTFLKKAKDINRYAEKFGARGFRSPVLYRNVDWFQDLNFSYDMSIPNVAQLEAQRGGCCTIMPYFLPGGVTELPLTTTEDYTLFNILNDYSGTLWKQQMTMIQAGYGLMHFLIHPDYIIENRAQHAYKSLLEELNRLRSEGSVWVTMPGEVDRWWRQRREMHMVPVGQKWEIHGSGSDRARVAYARLDGNRLVYDLD